jgi:hypothetical protein
MGSGPWPGATIVDEAASQRWNAGSGELAGGVPAIDSPLGRHTNLAATQGRPGWHPWAPWHGAWQRHRGAALAGARAGFGRRRRQVRIFPYDELR